MADQIVITEKSSQAKDVRAAVGSRYGEILPAEGHLFDLLEPEDVVPAWKRWSPILLRPEGLYGTRPAEGGNKAAKLRAIREALRTARRVWLATDCDREGQLIGQEILEHYEYRGQVMRVMFTAQDSQTIRDAFGRAKPNGEYARLFAAAVARRQADQIYNLSLTRTATVILGQGARRVIGVGRVKTPPWPLFASASWKSGTSCQSPILKLSPPRRLQAANSRCGTRRRTELSGGRLRKKLPMRLGASRAR
jgi:DNA topoisomerase III